MAGVFFGAAGAVGSMGFVSSVFVVLGVSRWVSIVVGLRLRGSRLAVGVAKGTLAAAGSSGESLTHVAEKSPFHVTSGLGLLSEQRAVGERATEPRDEGVSTATHHFGERMIKQIYKTHMDTPEALKRLDAKDALPRPKFQHFAPATHSNSSLRKPNLEVT